MDTYKEKIKDVLFGIKICEDTYNIYKIDQMDQMDQNEKYGTLCALPNFFFELLDEKKKLDNFLSLKKLTT